VDIEKRKRRKAPKRNIRALAPLNGQIRIQVKNKKEIITK
jgi:hypothetical protein